MTMLKHLFILLLASTVVLLTGCDTLEPDVTYRDLTDPNPSRQPTGGPVFENPTVEPSVARLATFIEDAFEKNAVGMAYAVSEDGRLAASGGMGWARKPGDGNVPMGPTVRMDVASVTKTVSAVATLQLLEQLGLSVDSPISPWLPGDWVQGAGFAGASGVTFRQLLNHTSGLNQMFNALVGDDTLKWGNDWDGLQFIVSNGTTPGSPAQYKNANFALLRVIIPALWKATGTDPGIAAITETSAGFWYVTYLYQRIFKPIGVKTVVCHPQNIYPEALAYNVNDGTVPGRQYSELIQDCGGHGWLHLSAIDLANFMANIRYNDAILSPANRLLMDSSELGWSSASNQGGNLGKYFHGGLRLGGSGREAHTCIMKYPNNLEATLLVNSSHNAPDSVCGTLSKAYDAAV